MSAKAKRTAELLQQPFVVGDRVRYQVGALQALGTVRQVKHLVHPNTWVVGVQWDDEVEVEFLSWFYSSELTLETPPTATLETPPTATGWRSSMTKKADATAALLTTIKSGDRVALEGTNYVGKVLTVSDPDGTGASPAYAFVLWINRAPPNHTTWARTDRLRRV